jgi:hypothetical protein
MLTVITPDNPPIINAHITSIKQVKKLNTPEIIANISKHKTEEIITIIPPFIKPLSSFIDKKHAKNTQKLRENL